MINWVLFGLFGAGAYILLSAFGQLGGGSGTSGWSAALATFKPLPFLLLVAGNILWSVSIYYGLLNTRSAIPAVIAVGVITGFVYSVFAMGNPVTPMKLGGTALVLVGIYLLQ